MESIVDVVTTAFEVGVAVCAVFTAGYWYNGVDGKTVSNALSKIVQRLLLPSFVLITLATSTFLDWKRLLATIWPILVINLTTHLASLALGIAVQRYTSAPAWMLKSLTYNNITSYPILFLYLFSHISHFSSYDQGIEHLKWRIMDTSQAIMERSFLYIVLNYVVVTCCRLGIDVILDSQKRIKLEDAEDEPSESESRHIDEEDATERTPLMPAGSTAEDTKRVSSIIRSPLIIVTVLGLLIGLIKPIQRSVLGITPDWPVGNGFWQSIGGAIMLLAGPYAVLDIVAMGAAVRAAEKSESPETVPPTLGNVLTIVLWRYGFVSAISISIVHGFGKISSTKAYLQDPAFSFILALTTFTPPSLSTGMSPYQSSVIFSTFYTSLLLALPIAITFGLTGRGIAYDVQFNIVDVLKKAGGGGLAGAAAMVVQVLTLMPLRTIMNYQYRYGGGFKGSTKKLWQDGGFRRYYAGLGAAIFQGPFARFGDTAANTGIIALLASLSWPVLVKTVAASLASAAFRMTLTPIDTLKTTQQTKGGKAGLQLLRDRIKQKGVGCLWYGALATAAATFVGHYPWFGTYNYLSDVIPPAHNLIKTLLRQAFIGFAASVVSDTVSNGLRVVKTYRQVHEGDVGYSG